MLIQRTLIAAAHDMATDFYNSVALHLRSTSDDSAFTDEFKRAGIHIKSVNLLADAIAALDALAISAPIVVAIAPAHHGGIALLELLAETAILTHVKVVLIDHEGHVRTAIKALRLGATDYFVDSMTAQEIQARIQALLDGQAAAPALSADMAPHEETGLVTALYAQGSPIALPENISINANLRAIRKGDMWVSLSPIEWRLFEELTQNRTRVVSFADLVRRGLNRERVTPSETSLLRLHMSRLRAKLTAHFDRELNIITLRGRGYMLA